MDRQSVATVKKMAQALDVPPEHFLEYRIWRAQEIMKAYPDLADQVYDLLVAQADTYDAYDKRENKPRSRGK